MSYLHDHDGHHHAQLWHPPPRLSRKQTLFRYCFNADQHRRRCTDIKATPGQSIVFARKGQSYVTVI